MAYLFRFRPRGGGLGATPKILSKGMCDPIFLSKCLSLNLLTHHLECTYSRQSDGIINHEWIISECTLIMFYQQHL